jgi:hypothetical protein
METDEDVIVEGLSVDFGGKESWCPFDLTAFVQEATRRLDSSAITNAEYAITLRVRRTGKRGLNGAVKPTQATVDWSTMSPRDVWESLKSAPKVAGPWTPHAHGFGCDCGAYPADSNYRKGWSYRPDLSGREVVDDACKSRGEADADLREQGWVLVDE